MQYVKFLITQTDYKRITVIIRIELVNILVYLYPATYEISVPTKNERKEPNLIMMKELYGMLATVLLFFKKNYKDIEPGFKANLYYVYLAKGIRKIQK